MDFLIRSRLATKYIVFELIPVFIAGVVLFLFALIMVQSFKLTEFIIIHGAKVEMMAEMIFYMLLSYLPILFPIAILFSVLFVYGRLSNDSEIVAFKSLGLSPYHLLLPAVIVGVAATFLSLQTTFRLAPWGKRNFDDMTRILSQTRPTASLKEGVFSRGFFDLVVYANKVDSQSGKLSQIFIYDNRDKSNPLTVVAKNGQIVSSNSMDGQKAVMRLYDGDWHRISDDSYTKIAFKTYSVNLFDPHKIYEGKFKPSNFSYKQLKAEAKDLKRNKKDLISINLELAQRWSLSLSCLIFAVLGVSLAAITNRRVMKGGSIVICIGGIVFYWTLNMAAESLARNEYAPPLIAAWLANILFTVFAIYQTRRFIKGDT